MYQGPTFWEQLRDGVLQVWSWLPKAGAFGIGFFVGAALFKPVVDLLAAIQGREKAAIELKKAEADSHDHKKEIEALKALLAEGQAQVGVTQARLKELGVKRYLTGAALGLLIGAPPAIFMYLRVPNPSAPAPPTAKYADRYREGYSQGYKSGIRASQKNRSWQNLSAPGSTSAISDETK